MCTGLIGGSLFSETPRFPTSTSFEFTKAVVSCGVGVGSRSHLSRARSSLTRILGSTMTQVQLLVFSVVLQHSVFKCPVRLCSLLVSLVSRIHLSQCRLLNFDLSLYSRSFLVAASAHTIEVPATSPLDHTVWRQCGGISDDRRMSGERA